MGTEIDHIMGDNTMKKRCLLLLLCITLLLNMGVAVYATELSTSEVPEQTEPAETTIPETTADIPEEPGIVSIPTTLEIDSENVYEGMDKAFQDGYLPKIENGQVHLVLPLKCSSELFGNKINVSLTLDTGTSSPFVTANYRKDFTLEKVIPKNKNEEQDIYLVTFPIALTENRKNGNYPVAFNITGFDSSGVPINCIYTLYVTITDGQSSTPTQPVVEEPTPEPVVYISDSELIPGTAMAGEEFTLKLTLKNSLTTKSVKNMMVTVDTGNLQINLLEDSNVFLIEKIDAGGTEYLVLRFSTDVSIPENKYTLRFSFSYDSSKTLKLSSEGTTVIPVRQPADVELVMPRMPEAVRVGETLPLSLQVMNMGRSSIYNVRCVVSGHGLVPSNTGYIGTMAAGSSASAQMELYIVALNVSQGNENGAQYGGTTGTIQLIYEDAAGIQYEQAFSFETTVNRPVMEAPQPVPEKLEVEKNLHWWIFVIATGGVILAAVVAILLGRNRKKRPASV